MMNRREFLKVAGTAVALSAMNSRVFSAPRSEKPNIILCMADDQGWGDMGYQGHPHLITPNFDAMAAEGLRFDRFYGATPICSPTRGSVLTGRHPNRFGCFQWGHSLRPQEHTIAEVLRDKGYKTGHFGKWHVGSVFKNSPVNPGAVGFDEWISSPNFYEMDPVFSHSGTAVKHEGESSMATVDVALDFIRRCGCSSDPFLAVVWFSSPHEPHEAAPEDLALYPDHPEEYKHFYGEITGLDRAVGKLRSELRALGIEKDTILWYCGDNGGLRMAGPEGTGGRGYKRSIYEGGLLAPGLLEWPSRIKTPFATSVPCTTSDIFPTLLEAVGTAPDTSRQLDGISLVPLIEGQMESRPKGIGFWQYPARLDRGAQYHSPGIPIWTGVTMDKMLDLQARGMETTDDPILLYSDAGKIDRTYWDDIFPGHAAWLEWPWKLHRIDVDLDHNEVFELYDLAQDPWEENDLSAAQPQRTSEMATALEAWLKCVVTSLNGGDYSCITES